MAESESSTLAPVKDGSSCNEVRRESHFFAGRSNQFDSIRSNNCGLQCLRACSANSESAFADSNIYHNIIMGLTETKSFTNLGKAI